ncbi:MAG: amidohydrolase [Dehalococcoidia bacterium]|nr:amidohydrolase [Dehalococcoidia bacterium]
MVTTTQISHDVASIKDETIALRRQLHQIPELSFEEKQTSDIMAKRMESLGLTVMRGIASTGVVAILKGGKHGKTLLVRADMDGLPMEETPGRPYGAKLEKRNHACGHDMNMAIVAQTAKILSKHKQDIAGTVAFLFQPADEPQLGARKMMSEGLYDKVKWDMVLSHHPVPSYNAGQVVVNHGQLWSSSDVLTIKIQGKSGMGAMRENAVDCAPVVAQLINALYALVHNESPANETVMFNVGVVKGGERPMAILGQAELGIRLAVYSEPLRKKLLIRIEEVTKAVCAAGRTTCTLESTQAIPTITNDATIATTVHSAAASVVGDKNVITDYRTIFSNDTGVYMEKTPGMMFMLGIKNEAKGITADWHTPGFDIDEDTLAIGVEIMSRSVLDLLK